MLAAAAYIVITEELKKEDAMIFEGVRKKKTQRHYVTIGRSKTMNSDHLPGLAVDIVPYINGGPRWDGRRRDGSMDEALQNRVDDSFKEISSAMKRVSKKLGIDVTNLYDRAGWDKPHWAISRKTANWDIRSIV